MKIIIVKAREHFRKEDLMQLDDVGAVFYGEVGTRENFDEIKELFMPGEKIFSLNPSFMDKNFDSLPWERLKKIPDLKGLCLATTSYGWVPLKELKEQGTIVTSTPGKATNAVAEGGYHAMVSLLRKIPLMIQNGWKRDLNTMTGREVTGLHAGVVGLGQIGSRFAEICEANGMNVSYWNRSEIRNPKFEVQKLEEIFEKCDVVYLSFATDPSLKGFITNDLIDSMKEDALLISCIDDFVFDKDYVIKRVQEGKLGGLSFESNDDGARQEKGNLWIVPDSYYYFTEETKANESRIFTESILSVVKGKPVNVVK